MLLGERGGTPQKRNFWIAVSGNWEPLRGEGFWIGISGSRETSRRKKKTRLAGGRAARKTIIKS